MLNKCTDGGILKIYFIKESDYKIKDGMMQMKRKYGKFQRKVKVIKAK